MRFSELSLAEKDSGLSYDKERLMLIGTKLGYGVTIADENDEYCLKIFAEKPFSFENEISDGIIKLSESLSKNTINSQRCEYRFIEVKLCKSLLLQEKLVLLIDFLDKLTELLNSLGIKGSAALVPKKEKKGTTDETVKNVKKIKLSFDFNSIKGLFGALIAALAMTFIASISVKFDANTYNSFSPTIGAYVLSGAATALIFFDYRFLAKKIDAFGVLVCPVLSILTAFFSSMTVGAKSVSLVKEVTFAEGFSYLGNLYEISSDLAAFVEGYMLNALIIAVIASIIICIWYFNRHPDEMFKNEKIAQNDEKSTKK